jgi:hypothetical protein
MELPVKVSRKCIAFRESYVNGSVTFVRCGERPKMKKGNRLERRFCHTHERAYREILLGILENGLREP